MPLSLSFSSFYRFFCVEFASQSLSFCLQHFYIGLQDAIFHFDDHSFGLQLPQFSVEKWPIGILFLSLFLSFFPFIFIALYGFVANRMNMQENSGIERCRIVYTYNRWMECVDGDHVWQVVLDDLRRRWRNLIDEKRIKSNQSNASAKKEMTQTFCCTERIDTLAMTKTSLQRTLITGCCRLIPKREKNGDIPELGLASKQGLSKPEPLSTGARDPFFCPSPPVVFQIK